MRDNNPTLPMPSVLRALRRSSPCYAEATWLVGPTHHRFMSPDAALRRIRKDEEEAALERAEFPRGDHMPPKHLLQALRWFR